MAAKEKVFVYQTEDARILLKMECSKPRFMCCFARHCGYAWSRWSFERVVEYCGMHEAKPKAFMHRKKFWNPALEPELVIYNVVLNACVPSKQWKGGACYKVMLESGNYDLVCEFFGKMERSGEVRKPLTYKELVRIFLKEGKVEEDVKAIRTWKEKE
ncbi:hypothetical protein ACSQ67_011558 [Phaseolus vulgaris]